MATLSASGIGSGLDVAGIVSQLMTVERQPLTRLDTQISDYRSQLSAYGRIKSALSSLQTAMSDLSSLSSFKVFSTSSETKTDGTQIFSATADETAAAGTYEIEVKRLAQNHKMGSTSFASTDTFGGTAGDQLNITIGTGSMTVDLSSAKTLEQIRSTINNASDNPGVTASIITGDGGQQTLTLTSNETGYEDRVQLSYGGSINSSTFNFSTLNVGITDGVNETDLDAEIVIDNTVTATRGSNSIDDVISGITLELKNADVGTAYTLDVDRNDDQIIENVQSFADAYNNVINLINGLRGEDGDLQGDSTLLSITGKLRSILNTEVATGGTFSLVGEIGLTSDQKTGALSLDTSVFTNALNSDFSSVANLFAKEDEGVAFLMEALADDLTGFDGLIATREDGIDQRLGSLEDRKDNMEYRLQLVEARYQAQFGALDATLAQMNSTSSYLSAQLATLPGFG